MNQSSSMSQALPRRCTGELSRVFLFHRFSAQCTKHNVHCCTAAAGASHERADEIADLERGAFAGVRVTHLVDGHGHAEPDLRISEADGAARP